MSRNNKNAKLIAAAREMSKTRTGGGKGPAQTKAVHGKTKAWWQKFGSYRAYIASLSGKRAEA